MKTMDVFSRRAVTACTVLISALGLLFAAPRARAQELAADDEAELMDYDTIVRELSDTGASRAKAIEPETDPFASVLLHGGVGLASTFGSFSHMGQKVHMDQRGFQAAFGIDLFSDNWLAEGSARSFSSVNYGRLGVGLKEFDLKIYYRNRMSTNVGLRLGAGLAARYLTVAAPGAAQTTYSTPSSIFALGGEYFIGRSVSVGAELSARNSLVDETADKSAVDATLRVDTHF